MERLGGSVCWASARVLTQGHEFGPHVGFRVGCGVYLEKKNAGEKVFNWG